MSVGIKVTPEQLHSLSASVSRGSGEIDGTLAGLRGQIVLSSAVTGPARPRHSSTRCGSSGRTALDS